MVALPNGDQMFDKMKEIESLLIGEDVEQAALMLGFLIATQLETLPKYTASGLYLFLTQTMSKSIIDNCEDDCEDDEGNE